MTTEELAKRWDETPENIAAALGNIREGLDHIRKERVLLDIQARGLNSNRDRSERTIAKWDEWIKDVNDRIDGIEHKLNAITSLIEGYLKQLKPLKVKK